MFGSLRLPLALVSLAAVAVVALLVFLPAQEARAPSSTPQEQAQAESQSQVESQAVTPAAVNVADGFQDRLFADAPGATALAFLPDGRLLVTDRRGLVRLHEPGTTNTTQALDISDDVCSNSERGLLGVAVDPDFDANGFVYLYYTYKKFGTCPEKQPQDDNPVNRVARFVMDGDTIAPDSGTDGPGDVLIDNIPSPNGNHNAGDLHFGKDDKLYVSTGDGACDYATPTRCQPENDASRDRNVLLGKILRVNTDGTIPADNPYAGASNGVRCGTLTNNNARGGSAAPRGSVCEEAFATGFRNPFRFAMDPDAEGTSLRVNDVGGARIEEIDQVQPGGDYGWNCREGTLTLNTQAPCPGENMKPPISQYSHNSGCSSITGGAFVPNRAGWPASLRDAYLYGDYVCGKIFSLKPKAGGGFSSSFFANGLQGGPVSLAFGPDDALYYTTYSGGGQVRRVAFVNNKAPVAVARATPADDGDTYGPVPLTVSFDASGSTDPENDPLTYEWDFTSDGTVDDDGDPDSNEATATHTYDSAGKYTATITVRDDKGNSDTAKVEIYAGNAGPPRPVIDPSTPTTFEVDQQIDLSGSAADDDPNVTLGWEVIRHHTAPNAHTHPSILDPDTDTGGSVTFSAPGPEDLLSTNPAGNYLEVRLTASDSQGLSETVSQDLKPETTNVRFATGPTGFYLIVNGQRIKAPRTLLAWENSRLNVYAPPQTHDGKRYIFRNWSDGQRNRHAIVTPQENEGYTARFRRR